MLGSGHGASLREDVAAAAIKPTLQGKETSLKMWKWSKGKENKKMPIKYPETNLYKPRVQMSESGPLQEINEYLKVNKTGFT